MENDIQTTAPQATPGVAEATPQPPIDTATAPETPTWDKLIESIDPKELRKHPRIAGIMGSELQRAKQDWENTRSVEDQTKADEAAKKRLRDLAQSDPDAFAREWLTEDQQRGVLNQINQMTTKARHEVAEAVGRALRDVPEWSELGEGDHQKLAEKLAGLPDEQVIPAFNRHVVEMLSDRKATKLFEQWKAKDLAAARESLRQEEAAKLLQGTPAPDTAGAKGAPGGLNIAGMSDDQFREHYERTTGRKW